MTVVSKTADLTRAINETVKELQVTQASLDAQVTTATGYATTAATHRTAAEGYRDTTATHAASVATDLATVQGNVTFDGIDAILAEKAVTAVDVFVYDTSLDSDGGAWRKRCQHTSWYNETLNTATRGARREFPAVAVIVAEAAKVTIYDGDDPALPMWKVLPDGVYFWDGYAGLDCVAAGQAKIAYGLNYTTGISARGIYVLDFAADTFLVNTGSDGGGKRGLHVPLISGINGPLAISGSLYPLSNWGVNDLAMTVLPDAPIDPATGLPVPTIAVATAGGVSVIKDDGTVVSTQMSTNQGGNLFKLDIHKTKVAVSGISTTAYYGQNVWDFVTGQKFLMGSHSPGDLALGANSSHERVLFAGSDANYVGRYYRGGQGLGLIDWNNFASSLVLGRTSTYNTGWMPGAIRGAFLSDTDDTDLVGGVELVTNGTFDTADNWNTGSGTLSISGGTATLAGANNPDPHFKGDTFPVTGGQALRITCDIVSKSTALTAYIRLWQGGQSATNAVGIIVGGTTTGSFEAYVTIPAGWTSAQVVVQIGGNPVPPTTTLEVDNISVKLADADRSANNPGLIVNGTITRTPVATGAELVAYSGFSASNYLEQPYNSALDFGTGDFCYMGWVRSQQLYDTFFVRSDGSTTSTEFMLQTGANAADLRFYVGGGFITRTGVLPTAGWHHLVVLRESGTIKIYSNGLLVDSFANTANVTQVGATLIFGHASNSASPAGSDPFAGSLALWRISATAPTADQIKKIYEDERKLFQPGAQCTLYGTSNAVTALAHDPKTNLLHVGTAQGRSVFDGLVRVSNTTTAVGTAISAVNGLIVEE